MLHQDCSAYPVCCFLKLTFAGCLDETAFRAAARAAVARHPLLHSTIVGKRRYQWVRGEVCPSIVWMDNGHESLPPVERLNIFQEQGLRLFVRIHEDSSELLIQFHHIVCDGIAIYQVVRDLLICYAAKISDDPKPKPPRLNVDLLSERGSTGLKGLRRLKLIGQQAARLPSVCCFFARTPLPLVSSSRKPPESPPPKYFPALHSHQFDVETSARIRSSLTARATLNDLLTRDLFLATSEFRRWQRLGSQSGLLRFMIPMNLRRVDQFRASAANMIGAIFLERTLRSLSDPGLLLQGIQRELDQAKRLKLGNLFNFALSSYRQIPGALKRAARTGRRQVSAVFTNIGRVLTSTPLPRIDGNWVCGNVVLRLTEPAAPITPDVATSFAAVWYANRLTLTLHSDSRVVTSEAAEKMLGLFVRRVRMSAGIESSHPVAETVSA